MSRAATHILIAATAVFEQCEDLLPEDLYLYSLTGQNTLHVRADRVSAITEGVPLLQRVAQRLDAPLRRIDFSLGAPPRASVAWEVSTTADGVTICFNSLHYEALRRGSDPRPFAISPVGHWRRVAADALPPRWHWATELDVGDPQMPPDTSALAALTARALTGAAVAEQVPR